MDLSRRNLYPMRYRHGEILGSQMLFLLMTSLMRSNLLNGNLCMALPPNKTEIQMYNFLGLK